MQNFPEMDLIAWDQTSDDYDHTEQADNWAKVNSHNHSPGQGVLIPTDGIEDGAITSDKLNLTVASQAGVSVGTVKRRGSTIVNTAQICTSGTYDWLATPDRVDDLVLPSGGLIGLLYYAEWGYDEGMAAIHLNEVQLKIPSLGVYDTSRAAATREDSNAPDYQPIFSHPGGLERLEGTVDFDGAGAYPTTGVTLGAHANYVGGTGGTFPWDYGADDYWLGGQICWIYAAPGTYDVGVKFLSAGGELSVRNRRLFVWVEGF